MKDFPVKEMEVKIKGYGSVYFRTPTFATQNYLAQMGKGDSSLASIISFLEDNVRRIEGFTVGGEEVTRENISNAPTELVDMILGAYVKALKALSDPKKRSSKAKK